VLRATRDRAAAQTAQRDERPSFAA
jgi:hypothetical protein